MTTSARQGQDSRFFDHGGEMNLVSGAATAADRARGVRFWLLPVLMISTLSACDQDNTQPTAGPAAQVAPQVDASVANLTPIELSAVVLDAMPPEGTTTLDRGNLADDSIAWIGDESLWVGAVRIRVGGTTAITNHSGQLKEYGWIIKVGKSNEHPPLDERSIIIDGGICDNDTDKDCTFSADQAFSAVNAVALCQTPRDNGSKDYYRLTSPGRAPMIAAIDHGQSNSGSLSFLELALAATATIPCRNSSN